MRLTPRWRKALLVVHVLTAVGWFGADLVLLTLAVAGLAGADARVVYPAAALLAAWLFAPLSAVVWLVGLVNGLGTRWGLFRYRWVLVKLVLTTIMLGLVLFLLVPNLRAAAAQSLEPGAGGHPDLIAPPIVSGSLLVFMTIVSVYKPWGRVKRAEGPARVTATAQPTPAGVRNVRR
ncbi:hypothetical protein [Rhizomonospora bruguierae]|uniref:hypothetical protein n=1 Tax=Rhizomonospora bruguierae TaxID=1581705 RepID=UPI001BCE930B|nr:hypothetical protein [Micromonospora sp. NBRC 107566]